MENNDSFICENSKLWNNYNIKIGNKNENICRGRTGEYIIVDDMMIGSNTQIKITQEQQDYHIYKKITNKYEKKSKVINILGNIYKYVRYII